MLKLLIQTRNTANMLPVSNSLPEKRCDGPSSLVPVSLLLSLHNALDQDHPLRGALLRFIESTAASDKKAHWCRAIVVDACGNLELDRDLWSRSINLGKQETRFQAAEAALAKLSDEMAMLSSFLMNEPASRELSNGRTALMPMVPPGPSLARLKAQSGNIAVLADQMKCGLSNNLLGTTETRYDVFDPAEGEYDGGASELFTALLERGHTAQIECGFNSSVIDLSASHFLLVHTGDSPTQGLVSLHRHSEDAQGESVKLAEWSVSKGSQHDFFTVASEIEALLTRSPAVEGRAPDVKESASGNATSSN